MGCIKVSDREFSSKEVGGEVHVGFWVLFIFNLLATVPVSLGSLISRLMLYSLP